MWRHSLSLITLLLPLLSAAGEPSQTLVISHVAVIDVAASSLRTDQTVVIENSRIATVAPAALSQRTILPVSWAIPSAGMITFFATANPSVGVG